MIHEHRNTLKAILKIYSISMTETTHSNSGTYGMTGVSFGDIQPGRLSGTDFMAIKKAIKMPLGVLGHQPSQAGMYIRDISLITSLILRKNDKINL